MNYERTTGNRLDIPPISLPVDSNHQDLSFDITEPLHFRGKSPPPPTPLSLRPRVENVTTEAGECSSVIKMKNRDFLARTPCSLDLEIHVDNNMQNFVKIEIVECNRCGNKTSDYNQSESHVCGNMEKKIKGEENRRTKTARKRRNNCNQ